MTSYKLKTYSDSYLFNNKVGKNDNENVAEKSIKTLKEFILKTNRIDKSSDAFKGIIEEVKRQQRSSIYNTILSMPNVVLCIGPFELPRAFKVSEMKDAKNNGNHTVFIDCTGLIEMTNNGYYICKKIDTLCAYLVDAAIYTLYRTKTSKLLDNSNITIIATECYVSLFATILDYLRIIGYAANKERIQYYIAKFFLVNMMGKDENDPYVNNIASKVSGLDSKDVNAIKLFYEDGMFDNIYTFVTALSDSFKLKGFNLEVFVSKWVYRFGTGTQYATELYTSLLVLLTTAWSGAYVVNQKQVENCCGAGNLTKIFAEIQKAAINSFDTKYYSESSEYGNKESYDNAKMISSIINKDKPEAVTEADFSNGNIEAKVGAIVEYYENRADSGAKYKAVAEAGINAITKFAIGESTNYDKDSLVTAIKAIKNVDSNDRYRITRLIEDATETLQDYAGHSMDNAENRRRAANCIAELRECKNILR